MLAVRAVDGAMSDAEATLFLFGLPSPFYTLPTQTQLVLS